MWLKILKTVIGLSIAILLIYFVLITVIITKYQATGLLPLILIVLGLALALVGILSNIRKNSPIKVGGINRAEFYGVMTVVIGSGISIVVAILSGFLGYHIGYGDSEKDYQPLLNSAYQSAFYWRNQTNAWLLSDSGYISSEEKEIDWESKYNELWETYKHTIWHYDAQAENLRKERDNYHQSLIDAGIIKEITANISLDWTVNK